MRGSPRFSSPVTAVICLLGLSLLLATPLRGESYQEQCRSLLSGSGENIEELDYTINWGIVRAGYASLHLTPIASGGEVFSYRIESTARSSWLIDVFYPVRDRITSLVDAGFQRSIYYSKNQREGKFKRDEVLEYDLLEGVGLYFRDGRFYNAIRLPEAVQDPISGLYRFRTMELRGEPGETARMYATDGRRVLLARASILAREEVTTPAGTFRCLKVELHPETLEGPFKRKKHGRIFVWFTDDDCRLPVKMSSEILIGTVNTIIKDINYVPTE